jgi:hypothetical protein
MSFVTIPGYIVGPELVNIGLRNDRFGSIVSSVNIGAIASNYGAQNSVVVGISANAIAIPLNNGVAIGNYANPLDNGIAIGYQSTGGNFTVTTGAEAGSTGAQSSVFSGFRAGNNYGSGQRSVGIGHQTLFAASGDYQTMVGASSGGVNTGSNNTGIGYSTLTGGTGSFNTSVGSDSGGSLTNGQYNTFLGCYSGHLITSGSKNTLVGGFRGNSGGLDIRTSSNNVVLSDGDGNIRLRSDSSGNLITPLTATPPTIPINREMVFNLTSDTNLRVSVRGTDGVTRVANITLA